MKGDLHTHTVHSDGACEPEQVFQMAKQAGLDVVAITDHDYIEPFDRDVQLAGRFGLTALHGTELSTYDYKRNRRVHILCYFPQRLEPVQKYCRMVCENRRKAGVEMAQLVAGHFPITLRQVEEAAAKSASIFKQHIMYVLMQAGYSTQMYGPLWKELFDGKTGSCVRTCIQPDVWQVLPDLHAAGAIVVLAHPFTYQSMDIMQELTQAGLLDGIEVWQSKTTPDQEEYLLGFARAHALIPTGGSDFHGAFASRVAPLGCAPTPGESIRAILQKKEELAAGR